MRCVLPALALLSTPGLAAERTIGFGRIERLRVEGDFEVRPLTGPPRAIVTGEREAVESVDLRVDGTTLTLRRRGGVRRASPVRVSLAAPDLRAASIIGGATVQVAGMGGDQIGLSVAGGGALAVGGLQAEQTQATLIGEGRIVLDGRTRLLRLSVNGKGGIDAAKVAADEAVVRLEGNGEVLAAARYTAAVYAAGQGRVTVAGKPKCTVHAPAESVVTCGAR